MHIALIQQYAFLGTIVVLQSLFIIKFLGNIRQQLLMKLYFCELASCMLTNFTCILLLYSYANYAENRYSLLIQVITYILLVGFGCWVSLGHRFNVLLLVLSYLRCRPPLVMSSVLESGLGALRFKVDPALLCQYGEVKSVYPKLYIKYA